MQRKSLTLHLVICNAPVFSFCGHLEDLVNSEHEGSYKKSINCSSFICEHDKSLVETSVTIKHVRAWLQKVAPFLKFAIFSIEVLVSVYGVPIPVIPDFIPDTNGEEQFNEVVEHMEKLLSDTNSQALQSLNNFLEEYSDCLNGDKLLALIRKHEGDIPEEAYGALATIAYTPKNCGWMSEMEIANLGSN
jgi:hypothetical protein